MLTTAGTMASSDGVKDETWKSQSDANEYVQKWPEIPKGIDHDNESYEVTIDANGHVSVSPDQIVEAEDPSKKSHND